MRDSEIFNLKPKLGSNEMNYLYEDYPISSVEFDLSSNSDFLRVLCVSDQPSKAFQANLSYQRREAEPDEG